MSRLLSQHRVEGVHLAVIDRDTRSHVYADERKAGVGSKSQKDALGENVRREHLDRWLHIARPRGHTAIAQAR